MTVSIDALAGMAAIDAANEGDAEAAGWDFNQVSALTGSPLGVQKAGLYDPTKPAKAGIAEELYAGRKAAMKAADVRWGTQAYKDWDAKTRALMGVKKGDKFSSGQWMETFGGMKPGQINEAAGNVQFYLDDTVSQVWEPTGRTVSQWAKPHTLLTDEQVSRRVLEAASAPLQTSPLPDYSNLFGTRPVSSWAAGPKYNPTPGKPVSVPNQEMHPLMVAGLKYGLPPGEIAKIIGSSPEDTNLGSYRPWTDVTRINTDPEWGLTDYVGTPMHELAGHRLLNQLENIDWRTKRTDFLNKQMPNVQALYETGGSQISPEGVAPYGFDPSQGEMVTSRAATVEDLLNLNAPVTEDSSRWGGTSWRSFANYMKENPVDWGESQFNPNQNLTNLEELGYDKELARQYETWERFNQELPPEYLGGDPLSPLNKTFRSTWAAPYDLRSSQKTGLTGWPLGHNHFLVDRLMARNPKLSEGSYAGLRRAMNNELNAALANPESTINKLSKYGLADEFWDYVEDYLSEESEDWSPSRARKELKELLGD